MIRHISLFALGCWLSLLGAHSQVIEEGKSLSKGTPVTTNTVYKARDLISLTQGFSVDADHSSSPATLLGLVDPSLLFDASYRSDAEIINPETRVHNENLAVGSTPGSFSVSGSGAATYSVPIYVAPGTAGMQPKISISYNSNQKRGLLGTGWSLNATSAITRSGKDLHRDGELQEVMYNGDDYFSLAGQRLVQTSDGAYGANGVTYEKEMADFWVVTSYGNEGGAPAYFVVETKGGTKLYYGNAEATSTAYLKLQDATAILRWYLHKAEDLDGNYMLYNYGRDTTQGEIWLESIEYTGNAAAGLTPYNKVEFYYETRSDKRYSYIDKYKVSQNKLLRKIACFAEGKAFKEYKPEYYYDGRTYLNELHEFNAQGEKFNSLAFGYEPTAPSAPPFELAQIDSGKFAMADFTGDAVTDLVQAVGKGTIEDPYKLKLSTYNTATSSFDLIYETPLDAEAVQFLPGDYSGDGKADLVLLQLFTDTIFQWNSYKYEMDTLFKKYVKHYYFHSNGNGFDPNPRNFPVLMQHDKEVIDIVCCTETIAPDSVSKLYPGHTHEIVGNQYHIVDYKLTGELMKYRNGDFNGDGIMDLLTYYETNQVRYLQAGTNQSVVLFGEANVGMFGSSNKGFIFDGDFYWNMQIADFNGDGKDDILDGIGGVYELFDSTAAKLPYKFSSYTKDKPFDFNGADGMMNLHYLANDSIHVYHYESGHRVNDLAYPLQDHVSHGHRDGDFNGDGHSDIFVFTDRTDIFDPPNPNAIPAFGRLYLSNGSTFTPQGIKALPFNITGDKINCYSIDVTGDGLEDLIVVDESNTSDGMSFIRVFLGKASGDFAMPGEEKTFAVLCDNPKLEFRDVNSDLRKDIIARPQAHSGQSSYTYAYNGSSFNNVSFSGRNEIFTLDINGDGKMDHARYEDGVIRDAYIMKPGSNDIVQLNHAVDFPGTLFRIFGADFNRDGLDDIAISYVYMGTSQTEYGMIILNNTGNGFSEAYRGEGLIDNLNNWRQDVDINGDGHLELIYQVMNPDSSYSLKALEYGQSIAVNKLTHISDGMGALTSVAYKPSSDPAVYTAIQRDYPLTGYRSVRPLVASHTVSHPKHTGYVAHANYSYKGARIHLRGLGYLGFEGNSVADSLTAFRSEASNSLDTNYMVNSHTSKSYSGTTLISESSRSFETEVLGSNRYYRKPVSETSTDHLTNVTNTASFTMDDWGNMTKSVANLGGLATITNTKAYTTQGTRYPAHVKSDTLIKTLIGSNEEPYQRHSHYTYSGHRLARAVADTGGPKMIETRYGYNALGLVARTVLVPIDADSSWNELAYDDKYRFVVSTTDHMGFTQSATHDPVTGQVLAATDIYGHTVQNQYDGWGRLVKSINPITGASEVKTEWALAHGVTKQTVTADGQPTSISYQNIRGQVTLAQGQQFNGSPVFTRMEYNADGSLKRQSLPYETSASLWNNFEYEDVLKRMTRQYGPGHDQSFAYNGLSQTMTNNLTNKEKTSLMNKLGQTVAVTDPGGTITYSYYSSGQLKEAATDDGATSFEYDLHGNPTSTASINAGTSKAAYNSLGQVLWTVNSKGDSSYMAYDQYNRVLEQTDASGTRTYAYVSNGNGKGQLASVSSTTGHSISYAYDSYGRAIQVTETIQGQPYTIGSIYGDYGRLQSLVYPTDYQLDYSYNAIGYLEEASNAHSGSIWKLTQANHRGQATHVDLGNGLQAERIYDNLGRITDIKAGTVQHLKYTWDNNKQLISQRQDLLKGLSESFTYDHLKRLETYQVNGLEQYSMQYDHGSLQGPGNITQKTDIGLYTYSATIPHAVEEVQNTDVAIPEIPQSIEYNHLNKASAISEGIHALAITYGLDGLRRVTELKENGVLKKKKTFVGGLYEKVEENGTVRELHYIQGPWGLAAIHEKQANTDSTFWVQTDHLGSYHVVTNGIGQKVEESNFGPWGRRRNPNTWDYALTDTTFRYDRGFTGHEHLEEFGLINMNGRMYDQKLARFLSPDPIIQAPGYTQSYNSYTYCFNNPLHYVDPSGYTARDDEAGTSNANKVPYDPTPDDTPGLVKLSNNSFNYMGKHYSRRPGDIRGSRPNSGPELLIYDMYFGLIDSGIDYKEIHNMNSQTQKYVRRIPNYRDKAVIKNNEVYVYGWTLYTLVEHAYAGTRVLAWKEEEYKLFGAHPLDKKTNSGGIYELKLRAEIVEVPIVNDKYETIGSKYILEVNAISRIFVSGEEITASGKVTLTINGQEMDVQDFMAEGNNLYNDNSYYLGKVSFEINKIENIQLNTKVNWHIWTPGGVISPVGIPVILQQPIEVNSLIKFP